MSTRATTTRRLAATAACVIALSACGGGGEDTTDEGATGSDTNTSATSEAAASTTAAPTTAAPTTAAPTTAAPTTAAPTTTEAVAALEIDGDEVVVRWDALPSEPHYSTPGAASSDQLFHIHTSAADDGFYLSFELYTAWGSAWQGETGTFDIDCADPSSSTGICVHFDPDGTGPEPPKGSDFRTTGSVTIHQLDDGGYRLEVHELEFSDGTSFVPFEMTAEVG